ncbi:MAG TPA: ABC transporter permease, partial [Gemmatimonadaceae bacterium]|nr:ABC transporter permease [Gemmatimonadaceae bacterium]
MMPLEMAIAWRYLRSRRGSRLLSLISIIAIAGVAVGVSALIVIIAVMNGLQKDLREKILVASPDIRVLTFGDDMRMDKWRETLALVKKQQGVVAAAPFVLTQAVISAGHDYHEAVQIEGIEPEGPGAVDVTSIRQHALRGNDFKFRNGAGDLRGAVLGKLLAMRLNAFP